MKVLSIDQGLANIGYSLISTDGDKINLDYVGSKTTSSKKRTEERLGVIYDFFEDIINKNNDIDAICMEEFFYGGNHYSRSVSIITTNQVSGVLLLLGRNKNVPVYKIQPTKVKKRITGKGNANKELVMDNIKNMFPETKFKNDHECDSTAIGVTYILTKNQEELS